MIDDLDIFSETERLLLMAAADHGLGPMIRCPLTHGGWSIKLSFGSG